MTREDIFNALNKDIYAAEQKLAGLREAREALKCIDAKLLTDALFIIKWMQDRG